MAFYNEKEQLYLETYASGVSLGASCLHMRDDMWVPRNEAPKNAVLWPIVFKSKSSTSMETHYSNIEREALGIWLRNISQPLSFP